MELQPDEIQVIRRVFAESPIEELRLEIGDTRLHVSKKAGALAPPAEAGQLVEYGQVLMRIAPRATPAGLADQAVK